jgi:hypothetical protein
MIGLNVRVTQSVLQSNNQTLVQIWQGYQVLIYQETKEAKLV